MKFIGNIIRSCRFEEEDDSPLYLQILYYLTDSSSVAMLLPSLNDFYRVNSGWLAQEKTYSGSYLPILNEFKISAEYHENDEFSIEGLVINRSVNFQNRAFFPLAAPQLIQPVCIRIAQFQLLKRLEKGIL